MARNKIQVVNFWAFFFISVWVIADKLDVRRRCKVPHNRRIADVFISNSEPNQETDIVAQAPLKQCK